MSATNGGVSTSLKLAIQKLTPLESAIPDSAMALFGMAAVDRFGQYSEPHENVRSFIELRPHSMSQTNCSRSLSQALMGRSFVHPLFDYLIIGGGISLILTVVILLNPTGNDIVDRAALPYFMLLSNSAHFAGSTVRLYTKPGTYQSLPFLTMAFPAVVLALLIGCLWFAGSVGPHLNALYLTWSPYHYAAQAYGLAVVYAYRSECKLLPWDKRLLWWSCLPPFLSAFLGDKGGGLHWLAPTSVLMNPQFAAALSFATGALPFIGFAAILLLAAKVALSSSGPLPMISVFMLISNAAWWLLLPNRAFVWATIFHGLQYLAIVTIFHVKDQMSRQTNRHGGLYHVGWFYFVSLALGYGLFSCLPWGFVAGGFGMTESIILSVAAINIHHFIVDAFIWRLKSGDRNRGIVESGTTAVIPGGIVQEY